MQDFAEEDFITVVNIKGTRYELPFDEVIGQYGLVADPNPNENNRYKLALIAQDGLKEMLPNGLSETPATAEVKRLVTYANQDLNRRLGELAGLKEDSVVRY